MFRPRFVALVIGLVGLPIGVAAIFLTDRVHAQACDRQFVYPRAINDPPSHASYHFATTCETIFADGVVVVLPTLSGLNEPQRVTVRNVGRKSILVSARQPADVIDPTVQGYSTSFPQQPILSGGEDYILLPPQGAITLIAMPGQIANAWFTESRSLGAVHLPGPPIEAQPRQERPLGRR